MQSISYYSNLGRSVEYLENLIKSVGLRGELLRWEEKLEPQDKPLIIRFDFDQIQNIINIISVRKNKVLIAVNPRMEFKYLNKLDIVLDKIFGYIDLSNINEYNTPVLLNYMNTFEMLESTSVGELLGDLEKILAETKRELEKVQGLHSKLVSLRTDKFKNLQVKTKYRAGEKSGGEVFDLFNSDGNLLYLMASSGDYIFNMSMMNLFEEIYQQKSKINDEDFRDNILKQMSAFNADSLGTASYCLMYFNEKDFTLTIKKGGEHYLIFNDEFIEDEGDIKLKIAPGNKLLHVSPGFIKNMRLLNPNFSMMTTYTKFSNDSKELLNEMFFEVTKNKESMFLKYDAFSSMIEFNEKKLEVV